MPTEIYLAPDGDDRADGSATHPFASLERAKLAVRKLRESGRTDDIEVECRGGEYRLRETVVFTLADTNPPGARTVYRAADGEVPVFGSGAPIGPWRTLRKEEIPGEAPADSLGLIFAAGYPEGVDRVLALFDGERRLPRATGTPFRIEVPRNEVTSMHRRDLRFPPGALRRYKNLSSVELEIIPMHPWTMCFLGIESIDSVSSTARLDNDPVYPLASTHHGIRNQVWPENVYEGLTSPWSWACDHGSKTIYLRTGGDAPPSTLTVPTLAELVRVEGRIDCEAPEDMPVRGIVFSGLSFRHGNRDTWDTDYAGTGLQHNWDFFDRANALVRFRGAEECALESCRLTASAGGGVRFDLHCRANRVASCEIAHIGGTGVLLAGYGPGTKDVNTGNDIVDNHIHHNGEDFRHSLGVFVWQSSKNRIANNTIHHTGYSAICVTGRIIFDRTGQGEASKSVRWSEIPVDTEMGETPDLVTEWWYRMEPYLHSRGNIIERNEIYRVMERLGDGNAIYVSGCGGGNIVRENYIHDIFGPGSNAMIRTDDFQYETTIERNLIARCGGPGVFLKHRNDFMNNLLVDLGIEDPEGRYEGRPMFTGYIGLRRAPIHGSRIERNIHFSTKGDTAILWEGAMAIPSWGASYLRECKADYNLFFSPGNASWASAFLAEKRSEGVEQHSIESDPLIDRPGAPDFRIDPGSPAWSIGFQPFSLDDVGSSLCRDTPPAKAEHEE